MKPIQQPVIVLVISVAVWLSAGCEVQPTSTVSNSNSEPKPSPVDTPRSDTNNWSITLPVLDALLADETFSSDVKARLQLTDRQIADIKEVAQQAILELRKAGREENADYISEPDLHRNAQSRIEHIVGPEKAAQLFAVASAHWSGNGTLPAASLPGAVPPDTRVVVNSPAFRMDVFENGQLIKSYRIGIGYPEFPLPTGLRKAETIIFNPSWTPPDEPWVKSKDGKIEPGKTIKPGDKLNPLGVLKIPIGLPSLIHGGKSPQKIGNFASHGCVGLTDTQAKDLAKLLARFGGVELTEQQMSRYERDRQESKTIKLNKPVPVELRYETIMVEDGTLHIYRDVYDRDTNTEQNLQAVLETYGVALDQLNEQEYALVRSALEQMSRDASGRLDSARGPSSSNASKTTTAGGSNMVKIKTSPEEPKTGSKGFEQNRNAGGAVTRGIKGQKEIVIEIAALKGKGYPAPVGIDPPPSKPKKRN